MIAKKIIKIILKVSMGLVGFIFLLLLILQLPPVQNLIAQKVLQKLHENVDIPLSIEKIRITFFNNIKVKNIYLGEPSSNDTIVFAKELSVSIKLTELLDNTIYIKTLKLNGASVHLKKMRQDSLLNIISVFPHQHKENTEEEKQKVSPTLVLNRLKLENINFKLTDEVENNHIDMSLDELDLHGNLLDLEQKKIELHSVFLDGISLNIIQSVSKNNSYSKSEPFAFEISLKQKIEANNVNVSMKNVDSNQTLSVENAHVTIDPKIIDISNNYIEIKNIELNKTTLRIKKGQLNGADNAQIGKNETSTGLAWNIVLDKLRLEENHFIYITPNESSKDNSTPETIFSLKNISSTIEQIEVKENFYSAQIKSMKLNMNEQLTIKNIQAIAKIDNSSTQLNQVLVETEESNIAFDAVLSYADLNEIQNNLKDVNVFLDFKTSTVANDFIPFLPNDIRLKSYPDVDIEGKLEGKLSKLKLEYLTLKAGDAVNLNLNGRVNNLPKTESLWGDITIEKLTINKNDLLTYFADTLLPASLHLPEEINIYGQLTGNACKVKSDLKIKTPLGNINTALKLNMDSVANKEFFIGKLDIQDFDVGALMDNPDTIGKLTLKGNLDGFTTNFKEPNVSVDINIVQMSLLDYVYNNIKIGGDYKERFFNGNVLVNDENVIFQFVGKINVSDSIPELNFDLDMEYANLKALNITPDSTSVGGNLDMAIKGKEWNTLQGNIMANHLFFQSGNQKYSVDSIKINLYQNLDSSIYDLRAITITTSDSVLAKKALIQAQIKDNEANLNYSVMTNIPLANGDDELVKGTGNFIFSKDSLIAETNLDVVSGKYTEPLHFDIKTSYINKEKNRREIVLSMEGNGLKVTASGNLNKKNEKEIIDASISIDSLNLALVSPFTKDQLDKIDGHLTGEFKVSGPQNDPKLNGSLSLVNTLVRPKAVNTNFIFENEKIQVNNSVFRFDKLTINDDLGNEAIVDGTLNLSKTASSNFNVTLDANNFQLLNKSAAAADMYYGKVIANLNASIYGTFESPVVSLNTAFTDESNFFFIVPQNNSNAQINEGIIEFVDHDDTKDVIAHNEQMEDTIIQAKTQNFELNTNITLTDKMNITLVTDPASNENLQIAGNGNLSFSINKSGKMSLAGQYKIESGKYRLRLYDVIRREFEIEKGSSLSWSGDLMEANANISAVYEVRTSTIELVQSRIADMSQEDKEQYSNPIKVKVIMNLTGNLLTPDIDFDIEVDKSYTGSNIEAAISSLNENESELNKQVFSLLIFNSFSGESMGGGNNAVSYELQNTARQSLSNILAKQLNRFSNQYIKGVDLTFDIESYNQVRQNEVSTRTDVSVDLSRNLFNDRLTVEVGGRVAVEENNNDAKQSVAANDLVGDFMLEYKLSKDGTYRLQAFNKKEFENEIDGEVTKTGISFIFNKDFSVLRDLFKRNKNKKSEVF